MAGGKAGVGGVDRKACGLPYYGTRLHSRHSHAAAPHRPPRPPRAFPRHPSPQPDHDSEHNIGFQACHLPTCGLQPAACSLQPPPLAHPTAAHTLGAQTPCLLWQVLSHEAADIRPINVRRELGMVCDECLALEKAAVLELKEGKEAKVL